MYGISTAWRSKNCKDGDDLLKQLGDTEIPGLELEYRVSVKIFNEIKQQLKTGPFKILSIHNFFPHPEILPLSDASGDAFLLSSVDEDERKLAVKYARRTIQLAHDLEAGAVVLHLGTPDIPKDQQTFYKLFDNNGIESGLVKAFVQHKQQHRDEKKASNLDAVLFSLDQLNEEAIKRNIKLGVENRYYFVEIPNFEEIGMILNEFDGGQIGYWHDCGHAQASQTFGFVTHEDFLKSYGDRLVGIHLHDCTGYDDHKAPGLGEIDFNMIASYLHSDTIKILEVHKQNTLEEIKQGVTYLKSKHLL